MHHSTLAKWRDRTRGLQLSRAELTDRRSTGQRPSNRASDAVESRVLEVRRFLRDDSALGDHGAWAIREHMESEGDVEVPSLRTIGRILARRGALDARTRVRRPSPQPGWYVPEVAGGKSELDSFDVIEALVIRGGADVEILTAISLHGGLCQVWPVEVVLAKTVISALAEHWKTAGLPGYAQFDNDGCFYGSRRTPDAVGRVSRMCMALGVVPVFAPPAEHGPQSQIEAFNGLWQRRVWQRFEHADLKGLRARSRAWVLAHRGRHAERIERAPLRREFPAGFELDLQKHPEGRMVLLRRTDERGRVTLMKRHFLADRRWQGRLVRCEVDLGAGRIDFYALRRRDPGSQPKLGEAAYELPRKRFWEGPQD